MKLSPLCLALIVLLLSACSDQDTQTHNGLYIWGHEVRSFQPCGSGQVYWVKTSPVIHQELVDYYQANTSKPYGAIYIEFMGEQLDEERTGLARDYDGLIRIDSVTTRSANIPTTCSQATN